MKATVKGKIISKLITQPPQGSNKKVKFQIAINQGTLENDTINLEPVTYEKFKEGDIIEMAVDIRPWAMNGKYGLTSYETQK